MSNKNMEEFHHGVQNRVTDASDLFQQFYDEEGGDLDKFRDQASVYQTRHKGAIKDRKDLEERKEQPPASNVSMEQHHEENKSTKSKGPGFIKRLFGLGGSKSSKQQDEVKEEKKKKTSDKDQKAQEVPKNSKN